VGGHGLLALFLPFYLQFLLQNDLNLFSHFSSTVSENVSDLTPSAITSSSMKLSWSTPSKPYGTISKYNVTYQRVKFLPTGQNLVNCSAGAGASQMNEITADPTTSSYSVVLSNLDSNAQYNVTVIAYTDDGKIGGMEAKIRINTSAAGKNVTVVTGRKV